MNSNRPLVVAANRDEFYARPALAAHWWSDLKHVFGGRDLEAKGTWLAVDRSGRFAAVTNWTQDLNAPKPPGSRGDLARDFLAADMDGRAFAEAIDGEHYSGFNLVTFDGREMVYSSNRTGEIRVLEPGTYGMTNARLGEEWPKAVHGARALGDIAQGANTEDLLILLREAHVPEGEPGTDAATPERSFLPCFIRGEAYGTRASTALIITTEDVAFAEQHYGPHGAAGACRSERFATLGDASPRAPDTAPSVSSAIRVSLGPRHRAHRAPRDAG